MNKKQVFGFLLLGWLSWSLLADSDILVSVEDELNDFHRAAADADFERYFSHFSQTSVFLGTDASERWSKREFMEYARPSYAAGKGWTYQVLERHVSYSTDGDVAWFDERLNNKNLGECRGSGVLVIEGDRWKVSQYNLTIPVPNDIVDAVVELIEEATTTHSSE